MKKMFFMIVLLNTALFAQNVRLGIYSENDLIEVKIVSSDHNYTIFDYLSDLLITIRWNTAENAAIGMPVSTSYSVVKTGPELSEGEFTYQKFILSGGTAIQLPQSWVPGTEYSLFYVPFDTTSSPNPAFELAPFDFIDILPNIAINMIDVLDLEDPYFKRSTHDSPVPVELTSFAAAGLNNKVELNWQTATETNNSGFEIQRTVKGYEDEWKAINFVEGAGNSVVTVNYKYTDTNPVGGSSFIYRLKQIDFDGTYAFFPLP